MRNAILQEYCLKRDKVRPKSYLLLIFLLFFTACSIKKQTLTSDSCLIVFKTKKFAFADSGFLKKGKDFTNLQVFSAGNVILNLKITKNSICDGNLCLSKKEFTKRYLSKNYPENILEDILNARVIFEGKGLKKRDTGFEQMVDGGSKFAIIYRTDFGKIYFKDILNKILIKISYLQR